jgi:replicative DNA helicase
MAASQGYHPFSHQRIRPVRVLVVDLENPTQAITQTAVPYMNMLRNRDEDGSFDTERLRFWRKPGGIDIRRLSDKAELLREIAFHRPELVLIGPIYKMYRRGANETYEDSADEAMAVLDELRTKYEFALVMEHHAAKGKSGERRDLSPMGSQRWMAWPEAGISLYKDTQDPTMLHVKRFRGDRLQGIDWPDTIMRDRTWLIEGLWNM